MVTHNSQPDSPFCVYCGEQATTIDHVPPRNIFPSDCTGLITVPSCLNCNRESSKDDEFFRNVLSNDDRVRKHPGARRLLGAYERSLKRPGASGLHISMLNNRISFPLISDAGIFYGEGTALQTDFTREAKVLERITKGLFFHEIKRSHPTENSISVKSSRHMDEQGQALKKLLELISYIQPEDNKTIGEGVFKYGFGVSEDNPNGTFWVLTFFQAIPYFVFQFHLHQAMNEKTILANPIDPPHHSFVNFHY